jgi:hypothetical protein
MRDARLYDGFCEKYAYKKCPYEMAAYERHAYEMADERHAYRRGTHMPIR